MTLEEFDQIVAGIVRNENGCMIWPGEATTTGYPQVYIPKGQAGQKSWTMSVSRLALSRYLGRPILPGMHVCHTCDVRTCVNPYHLYEGTHLENMRDMRVRNRVWRGGGYGPKIAP
jgi:hypothetical protein